MDGISLCLYVSLCVCVSGLCLDRLGLDSFDLIVRRWFGNDCVEMGWFGE